MWTGWLVVDLCGAVPIDIFAYVGIVTTGAIGMVFRMLRLARIIKLLKLLQVRYVIIIYIYICAYVYTNMYIIYKYIHAYACMLCIFAFVEFFSHTQLRFA